VHDFLFFYHPRTYQNVPDAQVGLGQLSLATYARDLGKTVRVVNSQADTVEQSKQRISRARYLCLYGCMVDADIINDIAEYVVSNSIADAVLVGGPISKTPNLLTDRNISLLVDGPGEPVIEDIARGRAVCGDIGTGMRRRIEYPLVDIDSYPFPDRTLVEGGLGSRIFHPKCETKSDEAHPTGTIMTSRGCNRRCAFCESGSDDGGVIYYSRERVEREFEHCLSLGIRSFRISDDNITRDNGRLEWICDLMRDGGVGWRASIRVKPNDVGMFEMMKSSGCEELSFGIESGDQAVLNVLRKGVKVQSNIDAVRNAKSGGISVVRALMMMCTPGETRETLKLNKEWVMAALPDVVSLKVFVPYPGTALYEDPDAFGFRVAMSGDYNHSAYRPDGSKPVSNIEIPGVLTREELTSRFRDMMSWIEDIGAENHG
jgi:radical SAM superfamily enzyme YgiQ (UPF0313 family)